MVFFFVMTYLKIRYLSAVYTLPTRCFQISLKAVCWYFFFVLTYLKIRYLSAVYTLPTRCFQISQKAACWYFFLYWLIWKYATCLLCIRYQHAAFKYPWRQCVGIFFCTDLFENTLLVCCVYATNTLLSNIPESSMVVFFFVLTYLKICYLSAVYTLPTRCFQISHKAAWWYFFL